MNAAEFNALYEVGVPVFAYPGCRPEDDPNDDRLVTRTRSKAEVLGGHTDVVWVDGHGACIALTHVDVVPKGEWVEARTAEQIAGTVGESFASMDDRGVREPSDAEEKRARLFGFVQAGAEESDLPSLAAALDEYVAAELNEARAETSEFADRVNELESRICGCEPVREHRDLRRLAFYQHTADCPVNAEVSS